ncbi:MAG: antitoxin Xre/MbcA/ParS toxin-binding domain-containing protein [Solidesulfovibrio sp.]
MHTREPQLPSLFDIPPREDITAIIHLLNKGLPFTSFRKLSKTIEVNEKQLAGIVNIPSRTIARRNTTGTFSQTESERILRIMRITERAIALFGNTEQANRWLKKPNTAFEGKTPLAYAETEPGAAYVLQILGRIEHGVFS